MIIYITQAGARILSRSNYIQSLASYGDWNAIESFY